MAYIITEDWASSPFIWLVNCDFEDVDLYQCSCDLLFCILEVIGILSGNEIQIYESRKFC